MRSMLTKYRKYNWYVYIFWGPSSNVFTQAEWMCGPICEAPEDTAMTCDDCKMGIQAKHWNPHFISKFYISTFHFQRWESRQKIEIDISFPKNSIPGGNWPDAFPRSNGHHRGGSLSGDLQGEPDGGMPDVCRCASQGRPSHACCYCWWCWIRSGIFQKRHFWYFLVLLDKTGPV